MRQIYRKIVSGVIFSKDGKVLMGLKDHKKGGVYSDCWHIPGGGIDDGETLLQALYREVKEEVGLDIHSAEIKQISGKGSGQSKKILETGEEVLCDMEFNRFEVRLSENAEDIQLSLDDDLVEAKWYSKEELSDVKQIPGGREFFQEMSYMDRKYILRDNQKTPFK